MLLLLHRLLVRFSRSMHSLQANSRGNVLMLFGLALIPLTFATGMGIDYARAMRLQTKLNAAADAAALAAVSKQVMSLPKKYGLPQSYAESIGILAARQMFITQTKQMLGPEGLVLDYNDPLQLDIEVHDTNNGNSRTAMVKYRGLSKNTFASILRMATLTVHGSSSTLVSNRPYIDIYLALDTSQSMGLAATDDDAKKLFVATGNINGSSRSCTFGCHVVAPDDNNAQHANGVANPIPNDQIAKNNGIQLRVDILRDAAKSMIQTAQSNQGAEQYYRFALFREGQSTSTISSLTSDLPTSLADVDTLTLGPNDSGGSGDSNLADLTNSLFSKIQVHGDGSTQAQARAFLFIVTDGTQDLCSSSHCMDVMNPQTCQQYKDANITVGIVYTTYLPVYANPLDPNDKTLRFEYTWLIQPLADKIAPALQACASPGWFFQAADGPAIHDAMQKLFTQASQTPTIIH